MTSTSHGRPDGRRRQAATGAASALALGAVVLAVVPNALAAPKPKVDASAASTNLVANPGFESSTAYWRTNSTAEVLTRVASPHSGSYSGQLTTKSTVTAVLNDNPNSVSSTTAGTVYTATAWVKTTTPSVSGELRIREVASGSQVAKVATAFSLSDKTWHELTLTYTAAKSGDNLDLNVAAYNLPVGKSLLIDDVSMTAAAASSPSPTASSTTSSPAPTPTVSSTTSSPAPTPTATTSSPAPTPTATTSSPAPSPTASTSSAYPRVASVQANTGESWADACVRVMSYGFNGCVRYLPAGKLPSWDTQLQALAAKVGTRPIHLQLTAKTHDDAGLADVITHLPAAWKPYFIYNIYQEPEDNLTTAAQQAAYRSWYTDAATVTRKYGVSLPWVEWHEYAGNWNLANFTPPAGDFGGVLWSFFEYNERDRVDQQVAHIQSMMATYAPGKPWGLMAGAYTLENAPYTDAQEHAQDSWMHHMYTATKAAGSQGFGWFNEYYPGTGGAAGEARIELNPYALPDFKSLN